MPVNALALLSLLRLDRTKPRLCSAAELIPFYASRGRSLKQSSPSACSGAHLFGKCGDPILRNSRRRPLTGIATDKRDASHEEEGKNGCILRGARTQPVCSAK